MNTFKETVIDTIKAAADYGMERLRTKAQEFLNKITQQVLNAINLQ